MLSSRTHTTNRTMMFMLLRENILDTETYTRRFLRNGTRSLLIDFFRFLGWAFASLHIKREKIVICCEENTIIIDELQACVVRRCMCLSLLTSRQLSSYLQSVTFSPIPESQAL
jgi:hypothetical protein